MSLSFHLSPLSSQCTVCCLLLCVLWLGCACFCGCSCSCNCGGGCGCGCVYVCVSSCLALKNASVCTFKTLPCVLTKCPCHSGHGRFERTHGSVFKVIAPSLSIYSSMLVSLSSRVSLSSSHMSLFFSVSFHFSTTHIMTMTMIARPIGLSCTRT